MKIGWTISTYLVRAVLPYFLMAWLILTVILFVQQAGRYSEIFFTPNLPTSFAWQIAVALIPNVIAFTCPMAVLVGVIIGMSRMQVDNELTAIRSFGVGSFAIILPLILLGTLLSLISIIVNIFGVPLASRVVRDTAMRSAVYKLESPIEPGVFNTEIAGYTIYVKDGDLENGHWRNVFVFNENAGAGHSRLITSNRGRIDSEGQRSELVLQEAVVSTLSEGVGSEAIVSERLGEVRLAIRTRRDEMVDRLSLVQPSLEEMGLTDLAAVANTVNERESREAKVLMIRRIVLAVSPIIFCILGSAIVLRFNRRGRGFGVLLALGSLLAYFLLTFAGEQLARSGSIAPMFGGLLPFVASGIATVYFILATRYPSFLTNSNRIRLPSVRSGKRIGSHRGRDVLLDITTGIRDFDLVANLVKYYVFAFLFVAGIFIVFTAFELWRFAGSFDGGTWLLAQYLVHLLPYMYLQVASTSALIAVLAVYTIKSRQNEIVTYLSAGESVYRLIFPCLLLMSVLGILNFGIQEKIATSANIQQEALRYKIRNRGVEREVSEKQWVATDNSIIAFETAASDNGKQFSSICPPPCALKQIAIYNFGANKGELQSVYRVSEGIVERGRLSVTGKGEAILVSDGRIERTDIQGRSIEIELGGWIFAARSPNQMSVGQIKDAMMDSDSEIERRTLQVWLEKKYATMALPLVIALFTLPFAIGIDRKSRVVHIAYAVGLWLVSVTVGSVFEQFGLNGSLPAVVAIWAPHVFFATIGAYLISRIRT